jgi:hypothetical protein
MKLDPIDRVKAVNEYNQEYFMEVDPSSMIEVSTVINAYVPPNINQQTTAGLKGSFLENIPAIDLEDIVTKGINRTVSVYKKCCKYYANRLAHEQERDNNIIVEHGIQGDIFRIFGYFKKDKCGGLGEPIWVNDEAFARYHKATSVTKITRAAKVGDKLSEVSVAMKDSPVFSLNMEGALDSMVETCKRLEITTSALKSLTTSTGSKILMRSSYIPVDDIVDDDEDEDIE